MNPYFTAISPSSMKHADITPTRAKALLDDLFFGDDIEVIIDEEGWVWLKMGPEKQRFYINNIKSEDL